MKRLKAYVNGEEISEPPEDFVESRENDLYTYDVYKTYTVLTGYKGESVDVTVPRELDGLPVTRIGELAFYYGAPVESVTLPNTVTALEDNAFYYCRALKRITLPDSITVIGEKCFSWCSSLTSLTLPRKVTVIPDYCFNECTALERVGIPAGVTKVGTRAFSGCKALSGVSFGETLTELGSLAFRGCTVLYMVRLPGNCKVGTTPFEQCGEALTVNTARNSACWDALVEQGMRITRDGISLRLPTQEELDAEKQEETTDPSDASDTSGETNSDTEG